MKAFSHLILLALLFQDLATSQNSVASSASSATDIKATTVTSTPSPATSTATPTTASPATTESAAPPGTNASTATDNTTLPGTNASIVTNTTTPPGTNTSTATDNTTLPGTNTSTTTNTTTPPGTNTSIVTNTTTPPGTNTSTATDNTTLPGTNTSTATNTTTPPGTNTSTVTNTTTPPGTNTSTATDNTTLPGTNTSTATNTTTPPGTNASTATDNTTLPGTNASIVTNTTTPPGTNTSTATDNTTLPGTNTSTATNTTTPPGTNTSIATNPTTPPGTNTSTATNTTTPPGTNTSTVTNTTTPPGTNTSTATNTTTPPGTNTSTATENTTPNIATSTSPFPAGSTALAPASNTSASTIHTPGSSTPCKEDSCQDGSLCVNLHNAYFCLCSEGYYYKSSTCNKGKIFPGTIKFRGLYTSELENKASEAYQNLYIQVTTFFTDAFNSSDYGQTVIVKVSPSASARSEMRADNQVVDVAVVNIFTESTNKNETTISNTIRNAISTHSNFSGYDQQDRCDYYGCKKPNDQNDCDSGLLCECKEGLARPNPQIPMCVASCSDACNAEHKRQCLVTGNGSNGSAACVCLPGYRDVGQETCQACAFGYSGINCKDSFQLILTIVGTIAGILLLGMLIALIVSMRLKNKDRDVEEETLIEKDSRNLRLKETGFSNLGAEGSIFPKIRVNLPRDNEPQNPYIRHGVLPRPDY